MGTITAVPVSIIVDFIVHDKTAVYKVYVGMALIVIGFLGFCISEFIHVRREAREELDNVSINVVMVT